MKLTMKQEKFCQAYVENGNASEAYRTAYDATKMKTETIHRKASELLKVGYVTARVDELKAQAREKHNVTIDKLLLELEEARQIALQAQTPQASAAIAATMGKARITGLDKQIIDHQSSDGSMNKPTIIELVAPDGD